MSKPVAARNAEILFLLIVTLGAFWIRLDHLAAPSLAEDEAAKWLAVEEYRQGHFAGVNSEHPMLMKLLVWASLDATVAWNRLAGRHRWPAVRGEAALRLPNGIVGGLATVVVYLLGRELFGGIGAMAAAWFWAFAPLTVGLNRICKEDTLATFFTYLAIYFFWRAKKTETLSAIPRLVCWSGACFGLAMASKYYLHFLGLNFLVWHLAGKQGLDQRPIMVVYRKQFWFALIGVFLVVNPVVLVPSHDLNILDYVGEKTLAHHGYVLNGKVYMNNIGSTPFGLPWYFYFWILAVKTPLPILATVLLGAVLATRATHSLSGIFLRVMIYFCLVPFCLVGAKWLRYILDMLPFLFLAAGWAAARLYEWLKRLRPFTLRATALGTAAILVMLWPAVEARAWSPWYLLYLNAAGGGRSNAARFFPPDELYDLGAREAILYVCSAAPAGATLAVSNPMVAGYYLHGCGRTDVRVRALFDLHYLPRKGDFILLQDARRYVETESIYPLIERHGVLLKEVRVSGIVTGSVIRF